MHRNRTFIALVCLALSLLVCSQASAAPRVDPARHPNDERCLQPDVECVQPVAGQPYLYAYYGGISGTAASEEAALASYLEQWTRGTCSWSFTNVEWPVAFVGEPFGGYLFGANCDLLDGSGGQINYSMGEESFAQSCRTVLQIVGPDSGPNPCSNSRVIYGKKMRWTHVNCPEGGWNPTLGYYCWRWLTPGSAAAYIDSVPVHTPPPANDPGIGDSNAPLFPLRGARREQIDLGVQLGRLSLQLSYDTSGRLPRLADGPPAPDASPPVLGALWFSALHRKILAQGPGLGALVARGQGHTVSFTGNGGVYTAPQDSPDRLESMAGGGYRYFDATERSVETYDSLGKLTGIAWAAGQSLTLTYSTTSTPIGIAPGADYLIQVQDSTGQSLALRYNTGGRLTTLIDTASRTIAIAYDGQGNLVTITWPDGRTRSYLYENAGLPWALTGVVEGGSRLSTYGYDAQGRAISSEQAGGVNRYGVQYTSAPLIRVHAVYDAARNAIVRSHAWLPPVGTTVTAPNGAVSTLETTTINGKTYLTGQTKPGSSPLSLGYDAKGHLIRSDDYKGRRTCYDHDQSRHLATVRVEKLAATVDCGSVIAVDAALPAGSRKTSTQWHPDWPLEAKRAEPKRITTRIYNGQPDPYKGGAIARCAPASALLPDGKPIAVLCKEVKQDTTDADGHLGFGAPPQGAARKKTWTYDGQGQVLTSSF